MDRAALLERLDTAWAALLDSYADLAPADLERPGVVGERSIKDVIAHVTSWELEALTHLPTVLEGRRPPRYSVTYGGIDAFNALTLDRTREIPLPEVLRQRDEAHERLVEYVLTVPEEQLATETRFRHRLRMDTYSHYPRHADAIRRARVAAQLSGHGSAPI